MALRRDGIGRPLTDRWRRPSAIDEAGDGGVHDLAPVANGEPNAALRRGGLRVIGDGAQHAQVDRLLCGLDLGAFVGLAVGA